MGNLYRIIGEYNSYLKILEQITFSLASYSYVSYLALKTTNKPKRQAPMCNLPCNET